MNKRPTTPSSDRGNCVSSNQGSPVKTNAPLPPTQAPQPKQVSAPAKPKSKASVTTTPAKPHQTPPPVASGSGTVPGQSTQAQANDPITVGAGTQEVLLELKDDISELADAKSIMGTEDLKKEKKKEKPPSGLMDERRGILVRLFTPL